jgi:xanthine dehydrogenase accessory factor
MPTDTELTNRIDEILQRGTTATLATIIETSVSELAVGAKMIVSGDGQVFGSLEDAALNEYVVRESEAFQKSREATRVLRTSTAASEGEDFDQVKILFERIEAEPRLVIAGAGHVGASLARLAAIGGFRVTLIDDRPEFVDRILFSSPREESIELLKADDWQETIRDAVGNGRGVSVAIVTRGHKQDEECLRATLSAKPDYLGMIGSKRRTNIVLEKLREEGADENELRKVRAPIGLDIGAVSPEEVALAILAEIVAERRGGAGASVSSWRRQTE